MQGVTKSSAAGGGAVSVALWTINRWLRWTGFRLYVQYGDHLTRVGISWYGLHGSPGWKRIEGVS